jgi:hypothetical protein
VTALLQCTCELAGDDEPTSAEVRNPLCPVHGDPRDTNVDAIASRLQDGLTELPLEELWDFRQALADEIRRTQEQKGRIEQELLRRALAARPDFTPEAGGTVEVVGPFLTVTVGYNRDYEYDSTKVVEAQRYLTDDEYDRFVKFEPKVNGTMFNALMKRGGELAALLTSMRKVKRATPTFTAKGRV